MADMTAASRRPPSPSDMAIGLGVVALAGVLAWQASEIPASPLYARVGPTLFPWIIVTMMGLLGLALTWQGFAGGWPHDEEAGAFDPRGFFYMALGIEPAIVPFPKLGFVLASTLQFTLTARAFESTKPVRDVLIGFTVAVLAYIGFDQVLGYRIGSGLVEDWIQAALAPALGAR